MKRTLPFAMALLLATAACGPAELVVTMEVEMPDASAEGGSVAQSLGDLEVQLLPFDRDAVFDSLEQAYSEPEPTVPEDLIAARGQVQEAQQRWRQAESRWNTLRDTLTKLSDAMEQYSRGESRYVALFREFQEFESQLGQVESQMNSAFEEFNELQTGTIQRSDSMRIVMDDWADEAFAGITEVFTAKQQASGLQSVVDTTDASGMVRVQAAPGQYWIHARYELPYSELYWNVPVTLERGEPVEVILTRENAEERISL